jgi:predicted DNA-binding transcriptional regulator YafY
MEDHPKFERMLRILLMLSNGGRYSLNELSGRFGMSERSISRYLSTFRRTGFIIDCEDGSYCIRKMVKPFKELSDLLHFSEEEAYILSRAIHTIDDTNILKSNLITKLYSLYDNDRIVETVVKPGNSNTVHQLIQAIRNQKQVLMRQYRSAHGSLVRDRLVEPFDFTANYISVWAYEPESRSCKLFKTARIGEVNVLNKDFMFADKHRKEPVDVFRISSNTLTPVKLRLTLRAYNLLIEEYPLAEQFITTLDDNYWHFEADVCGYEGVGRFVLGLMDEVQIIEPMEFKLFVQRKVELFKKNF